MVIGWVPVMVAFGEIMVEGWVVVGGEVVSGDGWEEDGEIGIVLFEDCFLLPYKGYSYMWCKCG